MLRTISAAAIGVALLGATALPASAAPASHPKTHSFSLPGLTGAKVWGSYYKASGKAHITACVKETASDVNFAIAVFTAFSGDGNRHQSLYVNGRPSKQVCKTMVTGYTASLWGDEVSLVSGKLHNGKPKKIY